MDDLEQWAHKAARFLDEIVMPDGVLPFFRRPFAVDTNRRIDLCNRLINEARKLKLIEG